MTAANSSKINDGAAAFVVMSGKMARELNLKPLFKIRGFGDAARDPVEFTTAPADAVPRALSNAGIEPRDVDFHEINEAFSLVAIVNARLMNLDLSRVNVHGGAVALGHPIGMSGARIIGRDSISKHYLILTNKIVIVYRIFVQCSEAEGCQHWLCFHLQRRRGGLSNCYREVAVTIFLYRYHLVLRTK